MIRHPLRAFFLLSFGIIWGVGALGLLAAAAFPGTTFSSSHPLYYVAGWGPTLAAVIVAGGTNGWSGVRDLLARARPTVPGLKWYFLVIVAYPAALVLAARLAGSRPGRRPSGTP